MHAGKRCDACFSRDLAKRISHRSAIDQPLVCFAPDVLLSSETGCAYPVGSSESEHQNNFVAVKLGDRGGTTARSVLSQTGSCKNEALVNRRTAFCRYDARSSDRNRISRTGHRERGRVKNSTVPTASALQEAHCKKSCKESRMEQTMKTSTKARVSNPVNLLETKLGGFMGRPTQKAPENSKRKATQMPCKRLKNVASPKASRRFGPKQLQVQDSQAVEAIEPTKAKRDDKLRARVYGHNSRRFTNAKIKHTQGTTESNIETVSSKGLRGLM